MLEELQRKLRRFVELRVARDEAKEVQKRTEKEYRKAEAELWDELREAPLKGALRMDLGEPHGTITFVPKETYFGRVLDEDKALEHFEQSARVDEMTTTKIVDKRLNEFVRGHLDTGTPLPEGIDFRARRYVSISGLPDADED